MWEVEGESQNYPGPAGTAGLNPLCDTNQSPLFATSRRTAATSKKSLLVAARRPPPARNRSTTGVRPSNPQFLNTIRPLVCLP